MRLDMADGKGGVKVFRVSAGKAGESFVIDTVNDERGAVERKAWVEETGGSAPLPALPLSRGGHGEVTGKSRPCPPAEGGPSG